MWRSQDLTSAVLLLALAAAFPWLGRELGAALIEFVEGAIRAAFSSPSPIGAVEVAFSRLVDLLLPVALLAALVTAGVTLAQVRPLWTLRPLMPWRQWGGPGSGLRQAVGPRAAARGGGAMIKVLILLAVLFWTLGANLRTLVALPRLRIEALVTAITELIGGLLWRGAVALLVIAMFDMLYQRHRYLVEQRMTRAEVRREQREVEGDPWLAGERRRLHRELTER